MANFDQWKDEQKQHGSKGSLEVRYIYIFSLACVRTQTWQDKECHSGSWTTSKCAQAERDGLNEWDTRTSQNVDKGIKKEIAGLTYPLTLNSVWNKTNVHSTRSHCSPQLCQNDKDWKRTATVLCEYNGKYHIVISDYYLHYLEVLHQATTTSDQVARKVKVTWHTRENS